MNLKPLHRFVIVRPDPAEAVTKSGIILAQNGDKRPERGTVLAVGSECGTVSEGDRVFFKKYAADELKEEGEMLSLVEETDVVAIIIEA